MEKSLRMENQKRKKVTGKKRKKEEKKKTGPKKKERVPFCQERKKLSLWKRQVLAGLHAVQISNKKSPANQNLSHIMFKTRFSFSLCEYQP